MSGEDEVESEPVKEESDELDIESSEEPDESSQPSIEIVDEDDDLAAVVEEAMDGEEHEEDEVESGGDLEQVETALDKEPLFKRWWNAEHTNLSSTLPEFRFLANVEVNRGLLVLSLSTIILQLWNMLFGIATSASGVRENSLNWWNFFFGSGMDSELAPSFSDPLGWAVLIASSCVLLSTMPRPKD